MKIPNHGELPSEDEVEVIDLDIQDTGDDALRRKLLALFSVTSLSRLFRSRLLIFTALVGLVILVLLVGANIPATTEPSAPISTPVASSSQATVVNIAASNGIAYIDAPDGTLSARQASDGKLLWQHTFVSPTFYLGAATGTTLYGISHSPAGSYVEALRASDGSVLWNAPVPPPGPGPLLVNDGVVYYNALDGTVYALRASDGDELWYYSSGMLAPLNSFLYASDGIASIHAENGTVHVVRGDDGTEFFQYKVQAGTNWQPVVENGIIYSSYERGVIQANRAGNGAFLWQTSSAVSGLWLWSEAEGIVYTYNAGTVKALRGTNGLLLWQYKTDSDLTVPPFAGQGIVYIVTRADTATALRISSGALLWQHQDPSSLLYGPFAADGIFYLGTDNYSVDAWRGSDDLYLWRYTTSSAILWNPLIDNGIMYLRQLNGMLDVVRMSDGVLLWHSIFL